MVLIDNLKNKIKGQLAVTLKRKINILKNKHFFMIKRVSLPKKRKMRKTNKTQNFFLMT